MASEEEAVDPTEVVKTLMQELEELKSFKRDVDEVIVDLCTDEQDEIDAIDEQIKELQGKQEIIRASMQEKAPKAFEDLTQLSSDIGKKETAIKKACHSLPLSLAAKGIKFKEGQVEVRVAKSTTTVTYSERVLDDHPEFDELYADGDPLVQRKVNSTVLERLVADGVIKAEDVAEYRVEARIRSPQVRVIFTPKDS